MNIKKIVLLLLLLSLLSGCGTQPQQPETAPEPSLPQPEERYSLACEAKTEGRFLEAMLQFGALGDLKDARSQYLDCGYAYAQEQLQVGNELEAAAFFEFVNGYKDAAQQVLAAKRQYILNHQNPEDSNVLHMLTEENLMDEPEMNEIYHKLYDWNIQIDAVNDSENGTETLDALSKFSQFYIHFSVTGGLPDAVTDLTVNAVFPDKGTSQHTFEDVTSGLKDMWICFYYTSPKLGVAGPLEISFYDGDSNLLKSLSVQITD